MPTIVINSPANKDKMLKLMTQNKPFIILFFANWCGYCQTFKPIWQQFTEGCSLETVECENDNLKLVNDIFTINAFPTVMGIKDNVIKEYVGNRTVDDLKAWVKTWDDTIKEKKPKKAKSAGSKKRTVKKRKVL